MVNVGNLGNTDRERSAQGDEVTFGWFGETIRANGEQTTDLAFVDFLEDAMGVDEDDPKSAIMLKSYLRDLIHEDDFDTFWRLAREHRQTSEDLMRAAAEIIGAVIGRPIQPSSDSSDGTSSTGTKSTDASHLRALDQYAGRPDLQNVIVMAAEHRARTG